MLHACGSVRCVKCVLRVKRAGCCCNSVDVRVCAGVHVLNVLYNRRGVQDVSCIQLWADMPNVCCCYDSVLLLGMT